MKRIIILIIIIAGFSQQSIIAQNGTAEGTRINLSTGLWSVNPVIMPVSAGMDFGITEEISLGFDIGWRLYDDGANHSLFVFQFRGDYYFNTLIGLDRIWDVYAGLQSGPGIFTAPSNYGGTVNGFNWTLDGYAGGRWYFNESMGLNAEVGLMGVFPDLVGPTPFMKFGLTFGI
jgi:hypothetical protein